MATNTLDLISAQPKNNEANNLSSKKNDKKEKSLFDSLINDASNENKSSNKETTVKNEEAPVVPTKNEEVKKDSSTQTIKNEDEIKSQKNNIDNQTDKKISEVPSEEEVVDETLNKITTPLSNNSTEDILNSLKTKGTQEVVVPENITKTKTKKSNLKITNQDNQEVVNNKVKLDNTNDTDKITNTADTSNKKQNSLMDNILKEASTNILSQNNSTGLSKANVDTALQETKNLTQTVLSENNENITNTLGKTTNEKLANELSKLNNVKTQQSESVDISKESLMDRLSKSSDKLDLIQNQKSIVSSDKNEITSLQKDSLVSNIYLSSQNNTMQNAQMIQKETGVQQAKNAQNLADIEKSAKTLELNLLDTQLEEESTSDNKTQNINLINKAAFTQTILKKEILESSDSFNEAKLLHSQVSSSMQFSENDEIDLNKLPATNLNLSQTAAFTIENRIIGARQEVRSMMSDVAKTMYENYRPPVTAFRLHLQPASLGTIAIIMKSDNKDNTIKVSMSMSNNSTHDAFVDNESVLKEAIENTFENGTNLSFDFSMFEDSNNGEFQTMVASENSSNTQEENIQSESVDNNSNSVYM